MHTITLIINTKDIKNQHVSILKEKAHQKIFIKHELQSIWINLLTPNVNFSGRTAPLTSKVAFYIFIQQI